MTALKDKRYLDYSSYIKQRFEKRVQKISINAGFTCPNLDGTKSRGGCTYCNNNTFNPFYCQPVKPVLTQIEEGISFFAEKYKTQEYLAFFQAFSNTYAEVEHLEKLYLEALSHPKVVGLVISTRPDCINEASITLLTELAKQYYISLEFGIESTYDPTLESINRCHTFSETIAAFDMARDKNLHLGGHLILGLPGESREILLSHAKKINLLPIEILKIHHLQIVKHTMMAYQYKHDPGMFHLFDLEEYIDLVTDFISLIRPDIILGRFTSESPTRYLVAPSWNGLKNFEITAKIDKALIDKNLWQGKNYHA
jgi:uncharacterized protein